jgi:3-hydroxyacyl-CoA dehydrogenase
MARTINKIAVIGAGTMGAGIAGVCASAGYPVVLLDLIEGAAEKAVERLTSGKRPAVSEEHVKLISCGTIAQDLEKISDCDWICDVIIEKLEAKQALFEKIEPLRKKGSIVSSNTSGIPLRDITNSAAEQLRKDIAITHFFNPVHIMKLLELVAGEQTDADVIPTLADFCSNKLGKGAVYAKDTVNFIGNRIGCFWILSGLHIAEKALKKGMEIETIDALMSEPMGFPSTGLYGLCDLIGLDIMESVGKNLAANLPEGDIGFTYVNFPSAEQSMFDNGQLGRKTGGGFYKLLRAEDGSKTMQVFDLIDRQWRNAKPVELTNEHQGFSSLLASNTPEGEFAWEIMSLTLAYSADLVPQIADDIVNIDRAMRWGFNWKQGPFELIDSLGAQVFIDRLKSENRPIPAMLTVLENSAHQTFYQNNGTEFLGTDGQYHAVPSE